MRIGFQFRYSCIPSFPCTYGGNTDQCLPPNETWDGGARAKMGNWGTGNPAPLGPSRHSRDVSAPSDGMPGRANEWSYPTLNPCVGVVRLLRVWGGRRPRSPDGMQSRETTTCALRGFGSFHVTPGDVVFGLNLSETWNAPPRLSRGESYRPGLKPR